MRNENVICDSHIHFIPKELSVYTSFYKGIWTDKEKLYDYLNKHNIEKALLGYPSTDAHLKLDVYSQVCEIYNSHIADVIKENSKIIGAAIMNVDDISTIDYQVANIKDQGFGAISIASSHNGKFLVKELEPLFEAAGKNCMPIFVHPQTINPIGFDRVKDPLLMPVLEYSFDLSMFMGMLMVEGIFEKYDVKFIFSSLGGVAPFLMDRFDRVYQMLTDRKIVKDLGKKPTELLKNIYVDTAGGSLANIKMAIELFGEDHIIWGSDYPVSGDVKAYLKMIGHLDSDLKDKITHKNFKNIFGA